MKLKIVWQQRRRTSQEKAQWGKRRHWKDPGFKNMEEKMSQETRCELRLGTGELEEEKRLEENVAIRGWHGRRLVLKRYRNKVKKEGIDICR